MPQPGFIWVQGTELRYVDGNGNVRAQTGTATGATGQPGYIWIQGNNIYYTDANGAVRYLPYQIIDNLGTQGFLWLEGTWIHYTRSPSGKTRWHSDVAHTDTTRHQNWSDWINDPGYSDYNKYWAHTNYLDLGKWLNHSWHQDWNNSTWGDVYSDHSNWGDHNNVPHLDQPALV